MEKREIDNYWVRREEKQVFKRTTLPKDWNLWRNEEKKIRKYDESYVHPKCEEFRAQEWDRRVNGYWMKWQGEYVYMTGLHYFHCTWMNFDFGYPDFREIDLTVFYALQAATMDPRSAGVTFATRRRFGKTAILFTWLWDYVTRRHNAYSGFQDVTDDDAKKKWEKYVKIVRRHMPDFFLPVWDTTNKGGEYMWFRTPETTGKSAIEDQKPSVDENGRRFALDSLFDFRKASPLAYDNAKLHRYAMEEPGKTEVCNVNKRWEKVLECLREGPEFIGKSFCPTTIEEARGEALQNFVDMFEDSFTSERDENGETKSGMYALFIPAYKSYVINKVTGKTDQEESLRRLNNKRKKLEATGDRFKIAAFKRKYPYNWAEAKMRGVEQATFDAIILNERENYLNQLSDNKKPYTVGNFDWVDQVDGLVYFRATPNGRWKVRLLPDADFNNFVTTTHRWDSLKKKIVPNFFPGKEFHFCGATDPVDQGQEVTDLKRASMAAAYVYWKGDTHMEHNQGKNYEPGGNFIAQYLARPSDVRQYFEDMIMMCRFYGMRLLIEKNKVSIINHFRDRGYGAFVMERPLTTVTSRGQVVPGIPGTTDVRNMYVERLQSFVVDNGHNIYFEELIQQMLDYEPKNIRKLDCLVAAGMTLLAAESKAKYTRVCVSNRVDFNKFKHSLTV